MRMIEKDIFRLPGADSITGVANFFVSSQARALFRSYALPKQTATGTLRFAFIFGAQFVTSIARACFGSSTVAYNLFHCNFCIGELNNNRKKVYIYYHLDILGNILVYRKFYWRPAGSQAYTHMSHRQHSHHSRTLEVDRFG